MYGAAQVHTHCLDRNQHANSRFHHPASSGRWQAHGSRSGRISAFPPNAVETVIEILHESAIPCRSLEDQDSPRTQEWLEERAAYTSAYRDAAYSGTAERTAVGSRSWIQSSANSPRPTICCWQSWRICFLPRRERILLRSADNRYLGPIIAQSVGVLWVATRTRPLTTIFPQTRLSWRVKHTSQARGRML